MRPLVGGATMTSSTSTYEAFLRDLRVDHLRAWFQLALRARDVVRQGPAALQACAASSRTSVQTLRRWAFAAERFTAAHIEELARWRDARGAALGVWHVVELARLTKPEREEVLIAMRETVWPLVKLRKVVQLRKYLGGTIP
jgi:hypothetical protein